MTTSDKHRWQFKSRFRRNAFGWRSQPAVQRVKEAVKEIKAVARRNPVLAAEGAIAFIERVSPALEQVDSSSGSIGNAVNNAVEELVAVIAGAQVDPATREKWLGRLWDAYQADDIPYIETLSDYWGELCASPELASEWADRLVEETRRSLSPNPSVHRFFSGTSVCLSALYSAERYEEILDILQVDAIWPYKLWAVRALAAMGKKSDAIRYAESCRGRNTSDYAVDSICEEILLSSGLVEEAYKRYGLSASHRGTFLATFRAIAKKYPNKKPAELLADLVETTPGEEAKWFAAAKDAGLYDEALALAGRSPCDPRTLARAARDFTTKNPEFAAAAGLLSLHWLSEGYGYEITTADVAFSLDHTMNAARTAGIEDQVIVEINAIIAAEKPPRMMGSIFARLQKDRSKP